MQLLPKLCMAATAGDGDTSNNGRSSSSSNKQLATAVSSSSSSTVSTSSSAAAAAAAVSEASSSSTSLPSLPSLSAATINTVSLAHVTTLLPLSTSSSAAAVAAAADGFVVARPACVALHDVSTLEATSSTSDDATSSAGSLKCAAHLHAGASNGAFVTGHQDGRLRVWRVSSRAPDRLRLAATLPTLADRLRRFPVPSNHVAVRRHHRRLWIEHADAVSGVATSADGRLLFSASWDRTLKVWALPSLRCLQSLPAHDDAVNAVAAAPDGTVYTGSADRRVRVWAPRPASDKSKRRSRPVYHLVATLTRHAAAVNAVAVGCGGHALYSGGNDRCVVVWEREDSATHMVAVGALRGHRRAVLSVACAAGGLVVSGAADQTVRAWTRAPDGRGYACVAVIDGHAAAVRSVAAARVVVLPAQKQRDGEEEWRVCSASFDGEVRVWSLRVASSSPARL